MTESLRFAILSDIHAGDETQNDTFVVAEPPDSAAHENPLADLGPFILSRGLLADWVINPGDLANRALTSGQLYGWRKLQELSDSLGAGGVIGTIGNHDVETHNPIADRGQILRNLAPSFPSPSAVLNAQYWRDGFYLDDRDPRFRILNINSCAEFPVHPGSFVSAAEETAYLKQIDRGEIPDARLRLIDTALTSLAPKPVNLLVVHHHPVEHQLKDAFKDTYGPMVNGDALVDLAVRSSHVGRWFFVHGHKHIPSFSAHGGSGNSPLILCAASVGGKLWAPAFSATKNQFHVLEFDLEPSGSLPITRGRIHSYAWAFGTGWNDAPPSTGLPATSGFGVTVDFRVLAAQIGTFFRAAAQESVRWREIEAEFPFLPFLVPMDLDLLETELEASSLTTERDRHFKLTRLSRTATW